MWISADGRSHLNMWGDPLAVLPGGVVRLIDVLTAEEREVLAETLWQAQEGMFDEIQEFASSTNQEVEEKFIDVWIPRDALVSVRAGTVDQLVADLLAVELRWRLDALALVESRVLGA